MITAESLLDGVRAELTVESIKTQQARPTGLTASMIGECRARAGYILAGVPQGIAQDAWRGARGTAVHEYLERLRDNGVRKMEQRVTISLAGLEVSGKYDEYDPETGVVLDWKTKSGAEARNPKLSNKERYQIAIAAVGLGATQAFVVLIPMDGGFESWSAVEVDIAQAIEEADMWVASIKGEDPDNLPKEWPYSMCQMMCPFFERCRPAYTELNDSTDNPEIVINVAEAKDSRLELKAAKDREKAAMARISAFTGVAGSLKVTRNADINGKITVRFIDL